MKSRSTIQKTPNLVDSLITCDRSGVVESFPPIASRSWDSVGFVWAATLLAKMRIGDKTVSAAWKLRFDELLAYKQTHGNCDVPIKWNENEQLGHWVSMQRQLKKRGQMDPQRLELLETAGFSWEKRGRGKL